MWNLYSELLIWVAAFGLSDLLLEYLQVTSIKLRATYYILLAILAWVIRSVPPKSVPIQQMGGQTIQNTL